MRITNLYVATNLGQQKLRVDYQMIEFQKWILNATKMGSYDICKGYVKSIGFSDGLSC